MAGSVQVAGRYVCPAAWPLVFPQILQRDTLLSGERVIPDDGAVQRGAEELQELPAPLPGGPVQNTLHQLRLPRHFQPVLRDLEPDVVACAAREKDPGDLNSGMLVDGMKKNGINAVWTPTFDDTEAYLKTRWQNGDLVITMGCGDINLLNDQIHRHQAESQGKE